MRDAARSLDALDKNAPVPDWNERLREYLWKVEEQDDAATTQKTKMMYLTPWVKWLKERGGRPTTQRLKNFLTTRKTLMRTSYWQIGRVIRDFCNHWAESWEKVELVAPLGQKREKPTLAMPADMLDAVSELVRERLLLFGPNAERVTSGGAATQLAKDLGK